MNRKLQLPLGRMRVNLFFIAALISCLLTVGFGLGPNVGITNAQTVRTTYGNNGLPWPISGVIEAENFDEGTPSDPAYSNLTPGLAAPADQFYRNTEVPIGVDKILGLADIAFITPGQWLEYTVNVAETGSYDIGVHVATPLDGLTFHIEFDGVNKTGTIIAPNTGCFGSDLRGGQCFQDVTVSGVQLTAGVQRMRVVFDSTGYTFDYYNFIRTPGTTPNQSLFTTIPTPFNSNDSDSGARRELGTKFQSNVDGKITAVRYWKGSWEIGTHTGRIWSANGTLLATVPFANETATGWQQAQLSTPLTITANTIYVVSVNANQYFATTVGGLQSPLSNQNLTSVADGNNGVFGNIGTFPTNSFQNTNYYRDVQFVPSGTISTPGPDQSLFSTSLRPSNSNDSDNRTLELGTKFQSTVNGQITAVRYRRGSQETGMHTGRIWSANGTLLATVSFANETATGWQEAQLSTPLRITANTTYVVSVNANQYFASTVGGLQSPLSNGNLRTVADGNNGVFGNIGTFPTNSFQNTNYFRDIKFVAS